MTDDDQQALLAHFSHWEYRCNICGQLRFFPSKSKPEKCGNCMSIDITIGRPGSLPTPTGEK